MKEKVGLAMRKSSLALFAALTAAPVVAQAAPMPCPASPPYTNCLKDDVMYLDGAEMVDGRTLASCPPAGGTPPRMGPDKNDCDVNYVGAVKKAIELATAWGGGPQGGWDQFVIWGQQLAPATNPPGPLFYRDGYIEGMSPGTNEVANIGLEMSPKPPGRPLVGWIQMGSTAQAPANPASGAYSACGRAPRTALDTPPAQPIPALCFPTFYTYFDSLAQATGAIYGPYLKGNPMAMGAAGQLAVAPLSKAGIVKADRTSTDSGVMPRVWNSLINTRGSIFGGNTFRDNGNGTYETTQPMPFYGINVPYAAARGAGVAISGTRLLRFQPLDLYVMGFLPGNAPELATTQAFLALNANQVYRPATTSFNANVGPEMGQRQGVSIRPSTTPAPELKMADIVTWNGGERQPNYDTARHFLRQLWIVVTKPQALIDEAASAAQKADPKMLMDYQTATNRQLDTVTTWRHQFPAYFYMLTQYRGRVITTYDGVEDNSYWEFGAPADDKVGWQVNGATAEFPDPFVIPNSSEIRNAVRFTQVSPNGGIHTSGTPYPVRVTGAKLTTPYNSVTVRMRIPPGAGIAPGKAVATLAFDNGPAIRIPTNCGNPAKAGCKQETFLIPDGKWRTYSATLDDPAFTAGTFTGLTFSPSSEAFNSRDPASEYIEVDFVRVGNVPSARDADLQAVRCDKCSGFLPAAECDATSPPAMGKMALGCSQKQPYDKVRVPRSDGFIDSEDNCPTTFNPLQEDGNEDGVGDACEDFDGDSIENAADNCPTTTNSRQRDQNGDGIGDVCDPTYVASSGCFLQPEALGGRMIAGSGTLVIGLLGAVVGLLALRRRRR